MPYYMTNMRLSTMPLRHIDHSTTPLHTPNQPCHRPHQSFHTPHQSCHALRYYTTSTLPLRHINHAITQHQPCHYATTPHQPCHYAIAINHATVPHQSCHYASSTMPLRSIICNKSSYQYHTYNIIERQLEVLKKICHVSSA